MLIKLIDIDVADEDTDGYADGVNNQDADGLADDVNTTAGQPFTLAANDMGDGFAHYVIITPADTVTGNYTITGTDEDDNVQSEVLATDTDNAVTSVNQYKTVTEVLAPSGIAAVTVDIGWTANGAKLALITTAPTDGLAHKVVLTPADTISGSFTIVGLDADGKAQSETLASSTNSAVTSVKYYKSITSITNAVVGAVAVDAGWADEVASITYPVDARSPYATNLTVDITGTINYTVQEVLGNVYDTANPQQDATWLNLSALASKTADVATSGTIGASAVRVILNSYSSGAEAQLYLSQSFGD